MLDTQGTVDNACGRGPKCDTCDTDGAIPLKIVWQRLVSDEGETCPRCGTTQAAVQQAVNTLAEVLLPLGIEPNLETRELDLEAFEAAPIESNRIWIADRPLEAWIGADVGDSQCCTVCGDNDCRTLEVHGLITAPTVIDCFPFVDWLGWSTRFVLFTGKGGVGKTTVAATSAVALADAGRRVLLVSTDPGSNLSAAPRPVGGCGRGSAFSA